MQVCGTEIHDNVFHNFYHCQPHSHPASSRFLLPRDTTTEGCRVHKGQGGTGRE